MNAALLEQLQAALERHFDALASERRAAGLPVFALEHDLSKAQIDELSQELRRSIVCGEGLSRLWLLWVVYATELGYDFDGDEYWQSYEKRTPQWTEDPFRRQVLRQCFERFESKFGGATPTGPWARQFSIIAWPITHAVLPRDLQLQMARTLFESRHEIAKATDKAAILLGALIARRANGASSRFRNFLEHEELTGRIARALLFPIGDEVDQILTSSTLSRIVTDLEASREAKSWLNEARNVAKDLQLRLAFKRSVDAPEGPRPERHERDELALAKCVAPTVSLRSASDGSWQGYIEIPSFAGWARANPKVDAFLRRSRCKIRGTDDVWHNRRWLLFGGPRQRILEWPASGSSWIRFEEREEETVRLIDDECRVRAFPWLFEIDDDDNCGAFHVSWRNVKGGKNYIVVHSGELVANELLAPIELDAKGAVAHLLSVPAQPTEVSTRCLRQLGLSSARTLKVWPAGLPALDFVNDVLEWSARFPLTLGIEHDETCDAFSVQFSGKSTTFETSGRKLSLVALGKLQPGLYPISVAIAYRATDGLSLFRTQATQHSFQLAVHSPVAGRVSRRHAPVLVIVPDPPTPSLDAMMNGMATCTVHGPKGRSVDFRLELMNGAGNVIHSEVLGPLELPVDQATWKNLIKRRDAADSVGEAYFKASSGQLVVDGHDLGKSTISLKHSMSPVRWHVTRNQRRVQLNLVDDTDHSDPVHAYSAHFHQPSQLKICWDGSQAMCIDVTDGGGLYVATANGHRSSIVVNSPPSKMSLADWRHSAPTLATHLTSATQVSELLCWIRDWTNARLVGPLAEHQRNTVLRELHRQLYATLCGPSWAIRELAYKDAEGSRSTREALESSVWRNPSFAIGLTRHANSIVTTSLGETCMHLLDHVGPYSICSDRHLCELALRIGMAPQNFADWAGSNACKHIDQIVNHKALLKATRLLALTLGTRGQLLACEW